MRDTRSVRRLSAVLLAFTFGPLPQPCYGGKVRVEVGPGADFASYKTYRWLAPKILTKTGVVENDPVLAPAMKSAVNAQLVKKGLTEVSEGGDLEISALALSEKIPQLEAVLFAGPSDLTFATPIATMGRYNQEGTLVVNMIDTRTKKSAWLGLVRESIGGQQGAGQKKLPSAAAKLFKKYPSAK